MLELHNVHYSGHYAFINSLDLLKKASFSISLRSEQRFSVSMKLYFPHDIFKAYGRKTLSFLMESYF